LADSKFYPQYTTTISRHKEANENEQKDYTSSPFYDSIACQTQKVMSSNLARIFLSAFNTTGSTGSRLKYKTQ